MSLCFRSLINLTFISITLTSCGIADSIEKKDKKKSSQQAAEISEGLSLSLPAPDRNDKAVKVVISLSNINCNISGHTSTTGQALPDDSASSDISSHTFIDCGEPRSYSFKYQPGKTLHIKDLTDGYYSLHLNLYDARGISLEYGSTTVRIVRGQVAKARVVLYSNKAGGLDIDVIRDGEQTIEPWPVPIPQPYPVDCTKEPCPYN